jgi:hypothetical protein
MRIHDCRFTLSFPRLAWVFELPNPLLLFRINGDHRAFPAHEILSLLTDIIKLGVAIRVRGTRFFLPSQ